MDRLDPSFPSAGVGVTLWWLGQASVALRWGEVLLLVDPYLSDTLAEKYRGTVFPHARLVLVPVDPAAITGLTAVLCTHAHTDHMDPGTIRAVQAGNAPLFVVPRAERRTAEDRGIPPARLLGVSAGETLEVAGVGVSALASAHEEVTYDAAGDVRHLGYVMDFGGLRIYHSGDCVPYDGQAAALRGLGVHLALLPVNGRDERRRANGVPGNFHLAEAVGLCREAGIPALMCIHWGMFAFNTVRPEDLRQALSVEAADLAWTVPELGVPYAVSTDGRLTPGRQARRAAR